MFRKKSFVLGLLPGISANSNENYKRYNFQTCASISRNFRKFPEVLNFRKIDKSYLCTPCSSNVSSTNLPCCGFESAKRMRVRSSLIRPADDLRAYTKLQRWPGGPHVCENSCWAKCIYLRSPGRTWLPVIKHRDVRHSNEITGLTG